MKYIPSSPFRFVNLATSFFIRHKTYTAFLFIITSTILMYGIFSKPKISTESYVVTMGPVKQSVKISGQVQSSKDANLSFQTAGSVSSIAVKPGDRVSQGKILATLSGGDAQVTLLQAEASLANATALYEKLKQGARKEELALKEQVLLNAKDALEQTYNSIPDVIQNVDATTADVVKNKFSLLFNFSNSRYLLSFSSCDQRLQSEIEAKRTTLENVLGSFQKKSTVITAISSTSLIDETFVSAYEATLLTNELVNSVSNLLLAPCSISNPALDGYRTSLSSAKTSMTALFSDIASKRSTLTTVKNTYNQASRDLELTKAGTDPYTLKAQAALVAQAEAQVASAKSGIQKTYITAPFAGIISAVDISLGETVTTGKTVISMLAVDGFEIEAKVPEIDIVKIKVGAEVLVSLDAYGKSVIFPAMITRINPTATQEGGVPVYRVIVTFKGNDERIKQGMTANIEIITESKSNILVVPARFIKMLDKDKAQVVVLVNGKGVLRDIKVGLRGTDGLVEVTEGLLPLDVLIPHAAIAKQPND